jgi:hypothetical protein
MDSAPMLNGSAQGRYVPNPGAPPVYVDPQPFELPPSPTRVASLEDTRRFFQNIMVIVMMSPSRYHLVKTVRQHFEPYFTNIYFCGPLTNDTYGEFIQGYDIVYGNEQYRAVSRIFRMFEADPKTKGKFEGYLYLHDDIMIHPWALAAPGRKNKTIPWGIQMGIANIRSSKLVNAVPGMSVEPQFRLMWPYWRKNRGKLTAALKEGGEKWRNMLRRSAYATPNFIYRKSKYSSRLYNYADLQWATFYSIVDTYYIPQHLALEYAAVCDIMEKHWVFGEIAIATAIRVISPVYQEMTVQFYWASKDCPRGQWHPGVDGFHRCRHDHRFSHLLYENSSRERILNNATYRGLALKVRANDPPPP